MRAIFKLTKAELQNLFYSPIAWLVLIAFFIQTGSLFFELLCNMARFQETNGSVSAITDAIFTSYGRVYPFVLGCIHLYIPLLTMGLMSKEYSTGSIKLLYSSPISNWQIIIGKYISMVVYALILTCILVVYGIIAYFSTETLDMPLVLSGALGVFLLICTYAAIGLFMSSLTSYQIVAAIWTFVVLTLLSMVRYWGQDINFVREITYWLSANGRSSNFIEGIISSEDVIYFILVISLFINFSIIRLNANRQKASLKHVFMKYTSVILFVIIGGYVTSRPVFRFYCDATYNQRNSITEESKEVLAKIEGPLKISTYVNVLGGRAFHLMPQSIVSDRQRFNQYLRYKPQITFSYEHYYKRLPGEIDSTLTEKEEALDYLKKGNCEVKNLKSWEELGEEACHKLEDEYVGVVRFIKDKNGKEVVLRTYDGIVSFPTEQEITAALQALKMELPHVAYLKDHATRETEYQGDRTLYSVFTGKQMRLSLVNNAFDVSYMTLENPIPEMVDILIISDPREKFNEQELNYIKQYLDKGGNLFLSADEGRQYVINQLINYLGVTCMPGVVIEDCKVKSPLLVNAKIIEDNGIISRGLQLNGSSYFIYGDTTSFEYIPMSCIEKDEKIWNELQTKDFIDESFTCDTTLGEKHENFLTSLALKRKIGDKLQKIVLLSDTDCLSGELLDGNPAYTYIHEVFRWLTDGTSPILLNRKKQIDNKMLILEREADILKYIFLWGFALFMSMYAIILLYRRMSK